MYPAIKATTDLIAQEAFAVWQQGGDYETVIAKRCAESNVTDFAYDVRSSLTRLIKSTNLNACLYQA